MSNDTFIREVDEELRGERMRKLWKRYGPFVIGAAVAVVLVVAVNEGWNWWQRTTAAQASDQFYAALEVAERGDMDGARAALDEIAAGGPGGYATLARFRQAGLLASAGRRQEAVAAYDALATTETNPRLRELALVMAAYLLVDEGDVAAVQQRVGGLAIPGSALSNAAREAIGLAQYAAGDAAAARATFEDILNDPLVDNDMRGRVQIFMSQLSAMGAGDDEAVAARAAALQAGANADDEPMFVPFDGGVPLLDVPPELIAPEVQPAPAAEPVPEVPQGGGAEAEEAAAAPAN